MRTVVIAMILAGVTLAAPKVVVPDRNWTATIDDNKLADQAPKNGLITDTKTFEKLWKSWRKEEKVPVVDFSKQFVLVTLSRGGPNRPIINATLEEGTLKITTLSTLIGGPGFGYSIALFSCDGVKKVGEHLLP